METVEMGDLNVVLPIQPSYKDVSLMRKSKFALAFLATLSIVATAQADDFSALLADLNFDDAPSVTETLTLTDPSEQQQLREAPTELAMPDLDMPELDLPAVSLQDPVAAEAPQTTAQIDLDAAFSLQESAAGVQAQAACTLLDHDKKGSCDECEECEEGIVCTPHTAPNLPSSSFYQYFRSNKCNSHVWDGYRQHCRSSNKHLNGTCDCFKVKPKKKKVGCAPICESDIVECTGCHIRPRRKIIPAKQSCNDCTTCETPCDG
jgi:hypothetical protein